MDKEILWLEMAFSRTVAVVTVKHN